MKGKVAYLTLSLTLLLSGCGGGDGGNDSTAQIPNAGSGSDTGTPDSEKMTKLSEFRVLDVGSELSAKDLGLSSWNPTAMVLAGNILYIANSQTESQILRYDLKKKRALTAIDPTKITGLAKTWDSLTDIEIYAGRLYVANYGSNRIDILDISTEQPQFIMALGTGAWWGDTQNYAMVHSNAVTADDRFIFAPDIQGRINVWQQSDITAQNHLKAKKYARLSLPGCERNCNARMEVMGDYLYTGLPNGTTYVHNLKNLPAGADAVAPILTQSGLSTLLHRHDDDVVYVARNNGNIERYKASNFNLNSILPNNVLDRFSAYSLKGQSSTLPKATDVAIYEQKLIHLSNNKIAILPMVTLQQNKTVKKSTAQQLLESKAVVQTRMLQDGESWEALTNHSQRHVYMDQILSATLDAQQLKLQSYSAVPVRNLQIQARIKDSDQWMLLAEIDQLTPFSTTQFQLKLTDQARFPLLDGSGSIQLAGLSQTTQNPSGIFELKVVSDTDTHVQKLNQIKAKWNIRFGTYNEPGKWCKITPAYAREWVIMMTNMAYMLSSPEFETLWFNHKAVMGHDFFGNAGKVDGVNGFYTAEDYKRVYQEILNRGDINLGVTDMGGGLGGGTVLGVDTWLFYGHYRLSGFRIIAHEFGHHWGGHSSAWAMEGHGFEAMIDWLNFYFQRQPGSLPYMDPNVNAFHLLPDSAVCQGINQKIVNGVATKAPWNKVDEYFKNNPMPAK